jgi:serine/threonine protein kinase
MTVQALVNGEQPYNGVPEKKIVERITNGDLAPTHYADLRPRELINFLVRCLQMDPKKRIKAASIQSHILVKGFQLSQHEMSQAFAALNTAPLESWDPQRVFPIL